MQAEAAEDMRLAEITVVRVVWVAAVEVEPDPLTHLEEMEQTDLAEAAEEQNM